MHAESAALMDANSDPWALSSGWEGVGLTRLYRRDLAGAAEAFERSLAANPIADEKASIPTALLGACLLATDSASGLDLIEDGSSVIFGRRDWVGRSILIGSGDPRSGGLRIHRRGPVIS